MWVGRINSAEGLGYRQTGPFAVNGIHQGIKHDVPGFSGSEFTQWQGVSYKWDLEPSDLPMRMDSRSSKIFFCDLSIRCSVSRADRDELAFQVELWGFSVLASLTRLAPPKSAEVRQTHEN